MNASPESVCGLVALLPALSHWAPCVGLTKAVAPSWDLPSFPFPAVGRLTLLASGATANSRAVVRDPETAARGSSRKQMPGQGSSMGGCSAGTAPSSLWRGVISQTSLWTFVRGPSPAGASQGCGHRGSDRRGVLEPPCLLPQQPLQNLFSSMARNKGNGSYRELVPSSTSGLGLSPSLSKPCWSWSCKVPFLKHSM